MKMMELWSVEEELAIWGMWITQQLSKKMTMKKIIINIENNGYRQEKENTQSENRIERAIG